MSIPLHRSDRACKRGGGYVLDADYIEEDRDESVTYPGYPAH